MLTPELIASVYSLLLLIAGCLCLGLDIQRNWKRKAPGLEPWRSRLFDFAAFFLGMFAVQTAAIGFAAFVFRAVVGETPDWPYGTVCQAMASYVGVLIVYALVLRYYRAQSGVELSPSRLPAVPALRAGFFYFLASLPLLTFTSLGWQQLLHWLRSMGWGSETPYQPLVKQLTELNSPAAWVLVVLMAGIAAPVVEELVFRAALYRFLKSRVHPLLALTASSLFFALMHLNLLQFVPLFLLAMLLGRAYERTGSVLVPICFHACFNLNTLLVVAIAPQILQ
ncbi:MAG: CPBP family intramembrane metalloprotease [Verrucomicrobiota bacterium JB024]|jgi:membrane protease YdiL (CAAX protease family)|nr:CPBP family intramembrane metalloprotease [Verrucomicrobiota bacterium JB024]